MATTHQAVDFLVASGEVLPGSSRLGPEVEIDRATVDEEAGPGAVSWVSDRGVAAKPERVTAYRGSLLVTPSDLSEKGVDSGVTVVPAARPKLAFSRLLEWLFAELIDAGWPEAGEGPISSDAVMGEGVHLAPGVVIGRGVVLGDNVRIGPNSGIAHSTIDDNVEIGANCSIGLPGFGYDRAPDGSLVRFPHIGRVHIGRGASIGSNTCIDRGSLGTTVIEPGAKVDNLVHIAHNVVIGSGSLVIAHAMIGGSTIVESGAWVAPSAAVIDNVRVGADAVVGMGAVVTKGVEPGATVVGNPARPLPPRG